MNMRKLSIIFFSIGFVMLISGGFAAFLTGLRKDHQIVLRRMEDVSAIFESFSTNTTAFEEYRDVLYTDVLGNVYYDTMHATDSAVKAKLDEYEEIVNTITEDTAKLDGLCGNVYYPQGDVNNMCDNYKSIYEQVVNYYVSDIRIYNSNIKRYNDYQKAINSNLLVSKYKTKYQYIDYNGDKVFDGKEE